ncbi:MAG TPA: hypothetical protein VG867_03010 [Rhizomicrobium sp.]|nr:hypothetical protein [Rhizomicrobium sp.]
MARIKLRIVLNKGRHGAPLAKLGRLSEQTDKFLRALAADCQVDTKPGEWLAVNFKNGSVEYDAEFQGDVDTGAAQIFSRNLEFLADYDPESEGLNGQVSEATAIEYARIGTMIDPDEVIGIGIYKQHAKKPLWREITYSKMASIRRELETPLPAYGAVQGILHAWFKEVREPYFQLRELSTDILVRVLYTASLYADVARAVQERTTMLMVAGDMQYDRVSKSPTELRADRIERMPMLSSAEFERFFGSAPNYKHDFSEEAS